MLRVTYLISQLVRRRRIQIKQRFGHVTLKSNQTPNQTTSIGTCKGARTPNDGIFQIFHPCIVLEAKILKACAADSCYLQVEPQHRIVKLFTTQPIYNLAVCSGYEAHCFSINAAWGSHKDSLLPVRAGSTWSGTNPKPQTPNPQTPNPKPGHGGNMWCFRGLLPGLPPAPPAPAPPAPP